MNIKLIVIGETNSKDLKQLIDLYTAKLKFYIKFELIVLKDERKRLQQSVQIKKEGEKILSILKNLIYHLVLLDDKGKDFTSPKFSEKMQGWMLSGKKRLVFVVGGAYGFSEEVYARADEKLSLSKMTFSHEMVRLFFTEQLYRAFSILNNEPYQDNKYEINICNK